MSDGPRLRWFVAAVILAQIAVPAVALTLDKPARFGFQMYSGAGWTRITVFCGSCALR